jgi:hypothetical protein
MKNQELKIGGIFTYEHVRDGEVIDSWIEPNIVVDEGLNYALAAAFTGGSPLSNWYIGVFKNNYTPNSTDVIATFPGVGAAGESTAEYNETTRPIWTQAGVVAKVVTNSISPAIFTFNTGVSIYGGFLASSSIKGGLTGKLAAASKFSSVRTMLALDVLNVTYTLTTSSI